MTVDGDTRAYDALSHHPRIVDFATITHTLLSGVAEARRAYPLADGLAALATERNLSRDDAATVLGNVLDVLSRGPRNAEERTLAHALAAHAMAANPPTDPAGERSEATHLLWLAVHTPFDATSLVATAIGERAPRLWAAVLDLVRGGLTQALGTARSLRPPFETIRGQMAPAPRSRVVTAVLGLTGILLVEQCARLFGRWALAYRTPAEIAIAEEGGVRVRWRIELLGRTLRDRDVVVPREALTWAGRDVRFSGAALYVGLLALAVGSYVGVSALVDGVRAASPTLLVWGLAIVALGVGLDFVFTCALPGARGRCRMLFIPRRGGKLCIGEVDKARADAMLTALAHR